MSYLASKVSLRLHTGVFKMSKTHICGDWDKSHQPWVRVCWEPRSGAFAWCAYRKVGSSLAISPWGEDPGLCFVAGRSHGGDKAGHLQPPPLPHLRSASEQTLGSDGPSPPSRSPLLSGPCRHAAWVQHCCWQVRFTQTEAGCRRSQSWVPGPASLSDPPQLHPATPCFLNTE